MRRIEPKVIIAKQRRVILDEQFKKEKVQLSDMGINDIQLKYCSQKIVQYVKQIELNHNRISSAGIRHLYGLKWKNLIKIQLMSNKIGNKGCFYLSRMKSSSLGTLFLNNNEICSSGLMHLSKAEWKNLKTLVLYYNRIGDGVKSILKAFWMSIQALHLSWNNIAPEMSIHLLLGECKRINQIGMRNLGVMKLKINPQLPLILSFFKRNFQKQEVLMQLQ